MKLVANRAIERLRDDDFVPHAVERSLALIEHWLPVPDVEVWEAVIEARLCFVRLCAGRSQAPGCFRFLIPIGLANLVEAGLRPRWQLSIRYQHGDEYGERHDPAAGGFGAAVTPDGSKVYVAGGAGTPPNVVRVIDTMMDASSRRSPSASRRGDNTRRQQGLRH